MRSIDINCDMGEGFPNDEELMQYISSCNIACGYHAGNEDIMKRNVELALKYHVAIGAHPGFADKENFGRKEQHLQPEEYYQLIVDQLQIMKKVTDAFGVSLHHVKPHGALYNMAAKDQTLARIIAKAVKDFNHNLIVYELSGSYSITETESIGLRTGSEVFADRTYQDDGSLTPRSQAGALIEDRTTSIEQVLKMIQEQTVISVNKVIVSIRAETVCIHGDGEHAVEFARYISQSLKENNIAIEAL